jgi:hypothetical protein
MAMDSTTGGVGGGGGGGRNRGRRGMWSAASTELEIALDIALGGVGPLGKMVRWGGSSRMGREGGGEVAHHHYFITQK